MNALFRLRRDMPVVDLIPFKYLVYYALLSDVSPFYSEEDDTKFAVSSMNSDDVYDRFADWDDNEVHTALSDLGDEGLLWFDGEGRIYVGEFRGKRFFPFEVKSSMFEDAKTLLEERLSEYGRSKSAKDKSRSRYIREQFERFFSDGVERLNASHFTEIHGFLYEIYTGGEIYSIRNKVEYFQTTNMLKAYDRFTVFSILVEGTLNYDKYRKKGVPTLTNVACMKDDVFRGIVRSGEGSKEYMRDIDKTISSEF